jgi:phospholipid/cholesterol/gamma-HCH transport system substrate-binding protein
MKTRTVEISVGFFVLIGLICIAYLTINLGEIGWLAGRRYTVTARFASVGGLKEGGSVSLAGVEVGEVERIILDKEGMVAEVHLKIDASIPLTEDTIASVKTRGLIGDKYVELLPGGSDTILKDGDEILQTESAVDLEEIISKYAFGEV